MISNEMHVLEMRLVEESLARQTATDEVELAHKTVALLEKSLESALEAAVAVDNDNAVPPSPPSPVNPASALKASGSRRLQVGIPPARLVRVLINQSEDAEAKRLD